jgi:hypothetical protein
MRKELVGLWLLASLLGADARAAECPKYGGGGNQGSVTAPTLLEASGLVASRRYPGVFWSHNDSGAPPRLYALDAGGGPLAEFDLAGAANLDWEDIAIGPGPVLGADYLYVGDIGDNLSLRSVLTIYRVAEPAIGPGGGGPLSGAVALQFQYPDGLHDAETLLSDPVTGDLFIVTKTTNATDPTSRIYRFPFPHSETGTTTLELVGTHTFAGGPLDFATTAGDISPQGDQILIRTYTGAFLWPREPGESVAQALASPPCQVPLLFELQGEAIAHAADGSAYYTTSERAGFGPQPLYRYPRLDATPDCRLDLSLSYVGGTLEMDFELGTKEPAFWSVWISVPGFFAPLWSVPVQVIDPPASLPTLSAPFPRLGPLLFVTALTGADLACWNWQVVDTGP